MEQQHAALLLVGFLILSAGFLMSDSTVKNKHICEGGAMEGEVVYDESECDIAAEYVGREEVENEMEGLTIGAGGVILLVGGTLAAASEDTEVTDGDTES